MQGKGWHGFHARCGGFGDPVSGRSKVNEFDLDFRGIEIARDDSLGFNADRAAGVIEFRGGFHGLMV